MNAAGKSGLGFIFDERDNKNILLFIITIALFNIGLIGNLMHEILGIALAILIIIHILLNFKWIKRD